MELRARSYSLVFSYGTVLWVITNLISSCNTSHLAKPKIVSNIYGQAFEGETFNLKCFVKTTFDYVDFSMTWETPSDKNQKHPVTYTNSTIVYNKEMHLIGISILIIKNAQKSDGGFYKCVVADRLGNSSHSTYLMTILKKSEIIIYTSESGKRDANIIANTSVGGITINVTHRGFPRPSFNWYSPQLELIQPSEKYKINKTNSSVHLQIKYLKPFDSGVYILKANNSFDKKELRLKLYVKGKPQVSTENVYVKVGEQARVLCTIQSFPSAVATFKYNHCNIKPKWPTCEEDIVAIDTTRNSYMASEFVWNNELFFKPYRPGRMICTGNNTVGITSNVSYILIGDITGNMTVYGVSENAPIAKGDEVIITCAALVYHYTGDLDWFKNDQKLINGSGVEIITTFSNYTYKKIIKFENIEDTHAGNYECRAKVIDSDELDYDSKFLNITVNEPVAPMINETNLGDQHKRALGQFLELVCKSTGIPKPNITWYKDNEKLSSGSNFLVLEGNSVLNISHIKPLHEGIYKCVASNRLGDVESSSQLKITNMPGLIHGWIIAIVVFIAILIISIIYLAIEVRNEREVLRQLKLAGLENFEKGALGQINPSLPLYEQADLLPYDRRFEFTRHKLKLGKQLGAGAFGVVFKARAEGIIPQEKETVVAVKMVKYTTDNEVYKALLSELKIMIHIGQHLNVVNLLGAVTKNIAKREVMVIVEYCRYGNVHKCLQSNQTRFINQIDTITDKIDPTIVEQKYSAANFGMNWKINNHRIYENDPNHIINQSICQDDNCYINEQNVMTTISGGKYQIFPNIYTSRQPACRSNYNSDSTEEMTINTSDLVSWAFQVARGMNYLSSRKVLHGDLAARNILLCEDNVVKICDFGLARSMYKNDNYKKQGESLLPIKWLALESLTHQVFSTYSDVWSFGIMMWEFFSLATVPYPGINANQTLFLKLKDGYRMEKPPYANEELYDIMLECWSANPEERPLFNELEQKLAKLLGEEVKSHFNDLNEPHLKINNKHKQQSVIEYLKLKHHQKE